METATRNHQRQIISKFEEVAVGQPEEIASQFLITERTNPALMSYEEEQFNLPLPWVYDSSSMYYNTCVYVSPEEIWDSDPGPSDSRSDLRLFSPLSLLFNGSFEEAKTTSSRQDQWLLVNLPSTTEFASHEQIASMTSNKRIKTEKICFSSNIDDDQEDMSTFWDKGFDKSAEPTTFLSHKKEETCSSRNLKRKFEDLGQEFEDLGKEFEDLGKELEDQVVVAPSWASEFEDETFSSSNHSYWRGEESAEVKEEQTCPSSNNTPWGHELEETMNLPEHEDMSYGVNVTFDESGLANSMISVTWE